MRYQLYKMTTIAPWDYKEESEPVVAIYEESFEGTQEEVKQRVAELNAPTRNLHKFTYIKLFVDLRGWVYSVPITKGWNTRYAGDPMEKLKELMK